MNREDLNKLSPEGKRNKIAESRGFKEICGDYGFNQEISDKLNKERGGRWNTKIPDYLNDLHAMRAAILRLSDLEYGKYVYQLEQIYLDKTEGLTYKGAYCATAAEQADAYLLAVC